jgi:cobaltochelatase CobS
MHSNNLDQLAQVIKWNPDWTLEELDIDINKDAIIDIFKSVLNKDSLAKWDKLMKGKSSDFVSAGSLLLCIDGQVGVIAILEKMEENKDSDHMGFTLDEGEEWVNKCRDLAKKIWERRVELGSIPSVSVDEAGKVVDTLRSFSRKSSGSAATVNALMSKNCKGLDLKVLEASLVSLMNENKKSDIPRKELKVAQEELEGLRKALAAASTQTAMTTKPVKVKGDGTIPSGTFAMHSASKMFNVKLANDFEVPVWEWEGEHPLVPDVDENYIFRPEELSRVLYAIITNSRAYLQGHTGSGKTTLIEQVAAVLKWPFVRINFDSEISRMDLIGRDTLTTDKDGKTISKFVDGILPNAMSAPVIACFDEIDFCRSDVAYVMQSALEGNGLRITEDGDRLVEPNPMFRMFATGNTVGQGDEDGMYQGARAQSLAFLDRFTVWLKINYLDEGQRSTLLTNHFPALDPKVKKAILQYVTEHLDAFERGKITQPISPRGMLAVARSSLILGLDSALKQTVLDRANKDDYATLKGVIDRVVA